MAEMEDSPPVAKTNDVVDVTVAAEETQPKTSNEQDQPQAGKRDEKPLTGPEKWVLTDEDVESLENVVADANTGEDTVAARPESESPLSTSTVNVPLPHTTTPDVVTTQPGALLRRPTRLEYDPTLYFDAETIELNREAFGLFDKDSSGEIDVKELKRVLKMLGHDLKKKQVQKLIDAVQQKGSVDGLLDFNEFLHIIELYQENKIEQELKELEIDSSDSEEENDEKNSKKKKKKEEKKDKKDEGEKKKDKNKENDKGVTWYCCGICELKC